MFQRSIVTAALGLSITASPAIAEEAKQGERQGLYQANSAVASLLSLTVPAALVFVPSPDAWALVVPSLGFGAGHLYAGDYTRGALVSLGGPIATLGTGLAFSFLAPPDAYNPTGKAMMGLLGTVVGLVGYGAWASTDAAETAERLNKQLRKPLATPLEEDVEEDSRASGA